VVYFEQVLQALIREGKVRKITHPKEKNLSARGRSETDTSATEKQERERSVGLGKG
jgi:ribosomal protein S19E (S16A)